MLAEREQAPVTTSRPSTSAWVRLLPSHYTVGALAVLGAVFVVALAPRLDTDLWWHLRTGAYIATHHAVPTRDFMSFTAAGHAWTDHEWLSELLLYGLYRLAGLWGPIVFFAAVICATYAMVYATMLTFRVNQLLALFVLAAGFAAATEAWGARPQMVTLFFLALYGLVLRLYRRARNPRLLLIFPATMLLWSNLHGGFVLGLVLLAVTLLGETLNRWTQHPDPLSSAELRSLALTLLATLAATVATPNGFRGLLYPLVWIFPGAYANHLTEWVSTDFHQPQMMVFEALLLALVAAVVATRPRLDWTHLLIVLVFTHLALSEVRNVSVWTVLVTPLAALYLQGAVPQLTYRRPLGTRRRGLVNVLLLALVLVLYAAEASHYINNKALQANERSTFPAGAIAYLRTHRLPPNVFNAYAWGGYVLWKMSPRYRDFIDGRANTLYSPDLLDAYMNAYGAAPGWRHVLAEYHVQDVLIDRGAPLAQVLGEDPAWHRVYQDDVSSLYALRSPAEVGRQ